jgi:hypothetical protein
MKTPSATARNAADIQAAVAEQLLPFFIDPAGGDKALARAMVLDQIASYGPTSAADLLRVGRIIGLRMTAVGNLRLSMDIQRNPQACWSAAASLSREADRIARLRVQRGTARRGAPEASG